MSLLSSQSSILSACFFFSFFITGTPMPFSIAALHCCSYCNFIGITSNFFFRNNASLAVPKPALQNTPLDEAMLLRNLSLSNGKKDKFLYEYFPLHFFENTCHSMSLYFRRCLMMR